jgi:RNA polymerase sigma-70 factor (ECF subfamily)
MELVGRYLPRMRGIVWAIFNGAAEDVEDAEQEILAALFRDLGKFRFQSAFGTYFFRFCRNKAIDLLRKSRRESRKLLAAARRAAALPDEGADPDEGLLAEARRSRISAALAGLSEDERLLLAMREGEGMGVAEIAGLLGVPAGTVKSRLFRTRERLAKTLGGTSI